MDGRNADRRSRSYWTAVADRMCRRLAVAVAALLALVIAAQVALHADGLRPVLSRTERLEGVPLGDG
ncbi:MAG: hypothetical protein A9Z00_04295 [Thermobacillus sp. ZCTH02-B1]|uniref:hypothetical protein n=1 Tax=Thermobacillus sp. ZCTH02-B1 TaxID=1858795 RepID=UPI000B584B6F|nr:hypothetical protein [Thermobacillus sp. ZCTH02-B1]OUM96805.1 MAG: hypothetical protein A9Z00_04295 [Thermobacillus sp. ZCTH02-B1]